MFDTETVDLLLSAYEQPPWLVTHQATSAVAALGCSVQGVAMVTDGEAGARAEGQLQPNLPLGAAGLRFSLTAGNYSFSTLSLTGR